MNKAKKSIIEEEQSLKNSVLWNMQKEFYQRQGMDAWNWQVPFYVTSNPYIANSYANIMLRFAQDALKNGMADKNEPFYIVELGAGSGAFSFYTIKRLLELKKDLGLETIQFIYVMTDMVDKNIAFWRQHPSLAAYHEQGILDFARFETENDSELTLMLSGKKLGPASANQTVNPMVLIANYVFDSMRQDIFYIDNNKAMEAFTTVTVASDSIEPGLDNVQLNLTYKETKLPHYGDARLDPILQCYTRDLDQSYILIPTGSIECIKNFMTISADRLCLLVSDKGFTRHLGQHLKEEPLFALHSGCFSLPVNFNALDKYFDANGGSCYHQFTEQALVTSLFLQGMKLEGMHETRLAAETFLNEFGHASIFKMYEYLESTKHMFTIDTMLPFLAAARWDPHIFNTTLPLIINQIKQNAVWPFQLTDLAGVMDKIAANHYYIPGATDTFFNIAVFFQEIQQYQKALNWYEQSLKSGTPIPETYFNMGLCYYFLEKPAQAVDCFKMALGIQPEYVPARGWISQIQFEAEQRAASAKMQTPVPA